MGHLCIVNGREVVGKVIQKRIIQRLTANKKKLQMPLEGACNFEVGNNPTNAIYNLMKDF